VPRGRHQENKNPESNTSIKIPATNIQKPMNQPKDKKPDCFGNLEIVFPMGDNGLRQTPPACFECRHKTECLRAGLSGQAGLKVHEEHIDRSYRSGMISFVERWSRKKIIERRKRSNNSSCFIGSFLRRKANRQ
jgi:hypothetical protein